MKIIKPFRDFLLLANSLEMDLLKNVIKNLIIAVFIILFLSLIGPLGLFYWSNPYKLFYIIGFGFITFSVITLEEFICPLIFLDFFRKEKWNLGKAIFWSFFQILSIGFANIFYIFFFNLNQQWNWENPWLTMIYATFLIGIFPSGFLLFIKQLKANKKNFAQLGLVSINPGIEKGDRLIQILDDKSKVSLEVEVMSLFYIESADNYVLVYQKKNLENEFERTFVRNSLSQIQKFIQFPEIVRCHRSFLVNLIQVDRISRNNKGRRLHFKFSEVSIPISRNHSKEVMKKLKDLTC